MENVPFLSTRQSIENSRVADYDTTVCSSTYAAIRRALMSGRDAFQGWVFGAFNSLNNFLLV